MFLPPAATAMYIHRWNRRNSKKSASKGRHLDTAGPRHSWTQAQLDSGTAGLLIYFHFLLFLLSLSVYAAWNFTNPWFTGMLGLEIITYFNDTNTWVSDSSTSVCLSVSSNFLLVNWDQQHQCGCRGRAWERGMVGMKNWGNWTGYSALGFQTWGLLWTTLTSVEAWVCWQLGLGRKGEVGGFQAGIVQRTERKHFLLLLFSVAHVWWMGVIYLAVQNPDSLPFFPFIQVLIGPSPVSPGVSGRSYITPTSWLAEVNEHTLCQRKCLKMDTWPNSGSWDVCFWERLFSLLLRKLGDETLSRSLDRVM